MRTCDRRGRRGERVFAGVSGRQRATKQHRVALLQRAETANSLGVLVPICVSCLDDRHPWVLLVKTVPLEHHLSCAFPWRFSCSQLGAWPAAAATREARRARATVCCDWECLQEGWLTALNRLACQMWTTTRQKTLFPDLLCQERAVALD